MEIHKPRPVHSWRELVTEVGVIVVGIVIALSAEQLLQGLEWREKISRADEQIRLEMGKDDGPEVFQRLAMGDCLDAGLGRLRDAVERGDSRAEVITAITNVDIPRHTYESDAYRAAEASGVLARLTPDRVNDWNYLYAPVPVLDRIAEREYFDATALHAIRTSGPPLSELEQMKVLEAVENLRRDNRDMLGQAQQVQRALKQLGIRADKVRARQMKDELVNRPGLSPCVGTLASLAGFEP